jgi:hypothetical protein
MPTTPSPCRPNTHTAAAFPMTASFGKSVTVNNHRRPRRCAMPVRRSRELNPDGPGLEGSTRGDARRSQLLGAAENAETGRVGSASESRLTRESLNQFGGPPSATALKSKPRSARRNPIGAQTPLMAGWRQRSGCSARSPRRSRCECRRRRHRAGMSTCHRRVRQHETTRPCQAAWPHQRHLRQCRTSQPTSRRSLRNLSNWSPPRCGGRA